jgi:hypothetical protein
MDATGGIDRGKLEERQRFLRKEHASQSSFYQLVKVYPESEGKDALLARLAGELAALEKEFGEIEAALSRPRPAPTLS